MAKILIVDDTPGNRSLLVEILKKFWPYDSGGLGWRRGARFGLCRTAGPGDHGYPDAHHGWIRVRAPVAVCCGNRPYSR